MSEQRGEAQVAEVEPRRSRLVPHAVGTFGLVAFLAGSGVLLSAGSVNGASVGSQAVTPNPTCQSAVGYRGDQVTGCILASPSGLTVSWSGYTDYATATQYVQFTGPGGSTTSEQIVCSLPNCQKSFALSPGDYTGWATLETGGTSGGTIEFDLVVSPSDPPVPQQISAPIVGVTATADAKGYWEVGADGNVYPFGDAVSYGSLAGIPLNRPIVGMAATPDGKGYWLVASDGGVFSFGDAKFFGSTGELRLNQPVVGMAATANGKGYWLVASDGGVFSFGDAPFYGSAGNIRLQKPVVGMAADLATGGYWLVASDGGIFSFHAPFYGSMGKTKLVKPIVGMEAAADGSGYRLAASDGGVFDFNQAFAGSLNGKNLPAPIVGIAPSGMGGYWLVGASATVTAFGSATVFGAEMPASRSMQSPKKR
jgi:hypothetical protein